MRPPRVCIIAIMTAACLATNYALIGLPNVKCMDFLVFISGLLFGPSVGVSVGALTWLIYGTVNPYGFCLPILLATTLSETIYGLAGGIIKRSEGLGWVENGGLAWSAYRLGALGFALTAIYDLLTNLAFAITFGLPVWLAIAYGAWFSLVHELSNAIMFAACTPALARVSRSLGLSGGGVMGKWPGEGSGLG